MDIVHPNFSTGKPCRCPWGAQRIHRDPERFGRTASKIDWLKSRPDYESNPKVRDMVNILDHSYPPSADAMFPWLVREMKKGRLDIRDQDRETLRSLEGQFPRLDDGEYHMGIAGVNHGRGMMFTAPYETDPGPGTFVLPEHIGEWAQMLEDMGKRRKGLDLMQHTFPELAQKMDEYKPEWDDRQRQHLGDVMHKFDDDWTIRRLRDYEETRREGEEMGSCVGSYNPRDYGLYSLRDKGNRPHATMEIRAVSRDQNGMPLPHGGEFHQIQGKENEEPEPEYMGRVAHWLESFGHGDRPTASSSAKTWIPIPTDPYEFLNYAEPEPNEGYDRYQLSPDQADRLGLLDDGDPYDYEGPPNWKKIAENALKRQTYGQGDRGSYSNDDIRRMTDAAYETSHDAEMQHAFSEHIPEVNQEFWNDYYHEYKPATPEEQYANWWKGQHLNTVMDGNTLHYDAEGGGRSLLAPPTEIHPDQQLLFSPQDVGTPWMEYPEGLPTQTTYSKVAATDHPLYYRWVFSPSSGEVDLANNNEPEVRYHGDMARDRNEPDLVHGYAYRIGGGYRLTDWEHKPVEDPYVVAQVMRKLRGEQGPANQPDWESSEDDWDRMHAGMPGEL